MAATEDDLATRRHGASASITIDTTTQTNLNTLNVICISDAVTGRSGVGAHLHTSGYIRTNLPVLFAMDTISTASISLTSLRSQVTTFAESSGSNVANISSSFGRIESASNTMDTESHVDVVEIISRVWSLAISMGPDYQAIVTSCLADNIGDGGGCLPGVTARLFGPYAQMLRELYEDALSVHLIQTLLSQEEVPPVEDLTAATASHINTHTIDDVSIETEDLDEHHHSNTRSGSPRP